MCKVKLFAKSECDLTSKVGVWAYTLYDYRDQMTAAKPFKKSIATMTHADCMAFVNALAVLSNTVIAQMIETLEIVTDSKNVVTLILEGRGQKHCEAAAEYWWNVLKPSFTSLKHINIIKSDRRGTGPADNITILKRLRELASFELAKVKELSY